MSHETKVRAHLDCKAQLVAECDLKLAAQGTLVHSIRTPETVFMLLMV